MNLKKMIEAQKRLDQHIIKEKGLEGKDLVPNTFNALIVELGEFANEGRWFKHWSNDQEPRTWAPNEKDICEMCNGNPIFFENGKIVGQCVNCDGCGVHFHNPLLEEYIDGVHFFLSIAIQKGWTERLYIYEEAIMDIQESGLSGGLTGAFLEVIYHLSKCYMETSRIEKLEEAVGYSTREYYFKSAWFVFIAIGIVGFGFTPEQIEEAYWEKNKVNHERQNNSY